MRKPSYPRIKKHNEVTLKTKNGYVTYYGCEDVKNPKKSFTSKESHKNDIWYSKSNYGNPTLLDQFVYEDKKVKATVKIYHLKNFHYVKWMDGRVDRVDGVMAKSNKWRSKKTIPTPYTPGGGFTKYFVGGCTPRQAIKWTKELAKDRKNIREYNKAIKERA